MLIDYVVNSENPFISFKIAPKASEYNLFDQDIYNLEFEIRFQDGIKEFKTNKYYKINNHKIIKMDMEPLDRNALLILIKYFKNQSRFLARLSKDFDGSAVTLGCKVSSTEYLKEKHKYFDTEDKTIYDILSQKIIILPNTIERKVEFFLEVYDNFDEVSKTNNLTLSLESDSNNIINIGNTDDKCRSFKIAEMPFKILKKYVIPRLIKYYKILDHQKNL